MNMNETTNSSGLKITRALVGFSKNYVIVIATVIMCVVFTFTSPYFLAFSNIRNILLQSSPLAIVTIAQALILLVGDFDLSLGQIVCFTSSFGAWMMVKQDVPTLPAVLIVLALGLAVGACNGFLVAYCKLPAFVATLGMQLVCNGLANIVTNASPIPSIPDELSWLGRGFIGGSNWGIPISVFIMIALYIIFSIIARRTRFGRNLYAIGGSSEAAYFAGINVKANKLKVFTLGGGIASFGGLVLLSRLDSAAVTNGLQYEFDAIISCVIGGISLAGGKGKVLQAMFGTIFLTLFFNGMTGLNVHSFIQSVLKGLVLIGAVGLDVVRNRRR